MLLDQDGFLVALGELYESTRDHGTVSITMKQLKAAEEAPCLLVRARTEKRKISTRVEREEAGRFQVLLTGVMRASCSNLEKVKKRPRHAQA
mmetsp:Transcript_19972/g.60475  ORF Transcript_19972/g.60475 Transcript_19972/m.60475 type:complete len:92 (-) Transcript_19972:352-627(-)|eukprot:CAMPEP_0118851954 /NCGR_PEP_ID=MMETSP1163-20130328/1185_1 /TAXON_ID=124430 /ORGANISM="Phaeomonas parva, Strain CCMP2877" /LENGTH=91 /DNA_ID=CAMNT_0006784353 /DNA_START=216 /DNA_END=491 /DNA_ORIENTATION=-